MTGTLKSKKYPIKEMLGINSLEMSLLRSAINNKSKHEEKHNKNRYE